MANAVYIRMGTIITWTDGGTEELDLGDGTNNLADAVSVGSYHDWGADPRPGRYIWQIDIDAFTSTTTPTIGETVDLYVTVAQTLALWTGPEAPTDAADVVGNTDRLKNLMYLGSAVVHSTTAGDNLVASGTAEYQSVILPPLFTIIPATPCLL